MVSFVEDEALEIPKCFYEKLKPFLDKRSKVIMIQIRKMCQRKDCGQEATVSTLMGVSQWDCPRCGKYESR